VTADNTTAAPPTPPTLTTGISYFDDASKNLYERGAASMVTTGSSAEQTTMTYAAVGGGGTELANERFGYDEGGRLRYHQRHQAGLGDIETRNEYDAMGRPVKTSTAKAYVDDAPATVVAKTEWDLASRKVTHFDPVVGEDAPVAKQVSTLDPLGRVTRTERTTTDQKLTLTTAMAYDEAGNTVFESDGKRFAVQRRFDAAGRQTGVVSHDKTHATRTWNDWNEPIEAVSYDADNKVAGRSKSDYTRDGGLLGTNEQIGASSGTGRRTAIKWADGGAQMMSKIGSITSMDANGLPIEARATETKHDTAGRITLTRSGETTGDFFDAEKASQSVFSATRTTFTGDVPTRVVNEEPLAKADYSTSFKHDGVGRLTTTREANTYETASTYDEAGHVLSFRRPGLAAEQNTYDSRGLARSHQLADGKTVHYRYDERGNVRGRTLRKSGAATHPRAAHHPSLLPASSAGIGAEK
jgi:YD repeat-containing protein